MRTRLFAVGGVALITGIAGIAVAASASAGTTTYEAEAGSNALTGGAHVASCRRCSGGSRVTAVGLLGGLTFTGVAAERTGATKIQVTYTGNGDRTAQISVNDGVATSVAFPGTRGDERTGTVRIVLPLRAGDNTLSFANPAGPAPDVDKIVITTDGTPPVIAPSGTASAVPGVTAAQSPPPTLPTSPSPTLPTSPPPSPPGRAGRGSSPLAAEVVDLVNAERVKAGCKPVRADPKLTAAAGAHSADMAARGYFDHTSPEGVGFTDRITRAGFVWTAVAENIAKGVPSAPEVMTNWMTSPGHRANIVNCGYLKVGVGVAADGSGALLWTQDFGK
jgi:uncharacterized protein YkwD